jgi:hypothetical protein
MLLVALLFLSIAASAGRREYTQLPILWDENDNGLSDSADVANGLMRAWNPDTDYEDFYCWPDSAWVYEHGVLGPCVRDSIARHLQVSYFSTHHVLRIEFPIAHGKTRVRIVMIHAAGDSTILLADERPRGLHKFEFVPVDSAGLPLVRGNGRVCLTIAGKSYERPVAWRWFGAREGS